MRLSFLLLLAAIFSLENLQAQYLSLPQKSQPAQAPLDFCATYPATQRGFRRSSDLFRQHVELERQAYDFFKKRQNHPQPLKGSQGGQGGKMADYILPVVVHLLHQNGSENISDAQILQGIQDLNDAFANVGYYDPATGVDTKIQFCLAKRDPNGNATTGINRIISPLTNLDMGTQDIAAKNLSRWNPLEYVNIWLVKEICNGNGCSVAGYAYFPSSHGQPQDGLMMEAKWFGSNPGNSSVIAHEMGHYLGLHHTFDGGCDNGDCLADGDQVCDTPPDNSTAPVPCDQSMNSCSTDSPDLPDQFWNYMDYGDWDCYTAFTQGQTDRMHFFIEGIRSSLLDSKGCQDPCLSPISASFNASATTVNVGATVNFTNTSTGGTTWTWLLDGVPFASTMNAVRTFNSLGTFVVTLQAANADPNCGGTFSDTIKVVCPVNASFTTSNLYPLPGETVNFTNASSGGATSYIWTVNGLAAGTAANLSYQIPAEGVYNICLQAGNGLCGDGFCQVVFAFEAGQGVGECQGSYLMELGDDSEDELCHAILTTPDGNVLLGGGRGNASLLTLVTPGGQVLWSRTFDFTSGADFIFEMIFDSDGRLLATGRDQLNDVTLDYIFKYDYQNDQVLWTRIMPSQTFTRLEILLEKSPGDNYFVLGMSQDDNIFMELNRNTGAVVNVQFYNFGQTDHFLGGVMHNGEIYMSGVQRSGGLGDIRAAMSKLNTSGNQLWTRFYFNSLNDFARTYFYKNFIENDTIVAYGRGDLDGDSFTDVELLLMKADLDGNYLWAKRYNILDGNTEFTGSILQLPDGYILQGKYVPNAGSTEDFFVMRVDKQGNLLWAKAVDDVTGWWGKYAVFLDGFIYFAGEQDDHDILFGKMSLDGEVVGEGCEAVRDISVSTNNVTQQYDGQHLLDEFEPGFSLNSTNKNAVSATLPVNFIPGCECETIDSCAIAPDAVLQFAAANCDGDSILVNLTICNDSAGILTQGTPVTFYLGNPTVAAAPVLTTQVLPQDLLSGDCVSFPVKLAAVAANAAVFVMVNDDGTTPTPWNFEDFPNTDLFECNFPNNLGSFSLAYSPPSLDLGNDVIVCHFATATFDAGEGFASYTWQDGSHEQTFTAFPIGIGTSTFWVTAVDSCGGIQTDSVTVTIDPGTVVEIGVDTAKICEGGSLNFSVTGFDHYAWTPADWLDCDTCATVTATPDTSGSLILVASTDDGCYSVDTVQLQVLPPQATAETIEFCPGTTVVVFGNPVSMAGDYSQTFSDLNGCDSTHTITLVEVTDTALIVDTVVLCSGDSVEFFGEWLSVSGIYDHFEPIGNCVQHNQLVLQVLPPLDLNLETNPPTCFGFSDGSLTVQGGQGNLQYSLDGVNWQAENAFDSLSAGSYEVFVLDENGCQFQVEFTVNDPPQVFVQLPPDVTIEWGDTLTLQPTVLQDNLQFSWSPPDWLSCTDCQNPVAQPEDTILYVLTVADPNDCPASDSIQINVELTKAVFVPNVFTPNGDGINDNFYLFGDGVAEVLLLRIFDRWGELVFEGANFPPNDERFSWDGMFRGKPMNSAVFAWYAIVGYVDGEEEILKGDLTLLR